MEREDQSDDSSGKTWRPPTERERAQFRKLANERVAASLDMFEANAPKYAKALGTFREALRKSGFSNEESMQIVLKYVEGPSGRPGMGGFRGHWRWRKG